MFNTTGQTGVFGNQPNQNLFGQTQNQQTPFFGSTNSNVNGTTIKYVPVNGADTIQKNGSTVNVSTKLNCISAMKEYEAKSLEELRFDDYSANRIIPQKSGLFGNNQTSPSMFGAQQPMFQSTTPFGSNQQTPLSGGTPNALFAINNQTSTFGSKNLFGGGTATSTNSAFGSFNAPSKPSSIFGMGVSTANKPIFGSPQPTQSTSIFGATSQNQQTTLFGNQQPVQQTGFFGGLQPAQQSQTAGLFNTNTPTSSFGFQAQTSTGMFGGTNNAAKPFGGTNTTFSFPSSSVQSTSLFGTTTPSSGLFSQNASNTVFGSTSKSTLFSATNTFTTPVSSQAQGMFPTSTGGFGQNNLFGNQPKSQSLFGGFNNNAQKTGIFGTTTNTTPGFGTQNTSIFGGFGASSQPFGSTITTNTITPYNNTSQLSINTPTEALLHQQMMQQKILSLVSNRPYGVNKLFMGQSFNTEVKSTPCSTSNGGGDSTNLLSLVIKRNESDKSAVNQRRRILNQKTKIIPNHLHKMFSGFDEDEDQSTNKSSSNVDSFFFTKREDWKYLPPTAFDKPRRSLNANNSLFDSHDNKRTTNLMSSPLASASQFMKDNDKNYHSTPLSDNSSPFRKTEFAYTSPIFNGKSSPISFMPSDKKESFVNNNNDKEQPRFNNNIMKEESLVKNITVNKGSSANNLSEHNSNVVSTNDDVDDESINGDENMQCCVILTKEGYYIRPNIEELDKLVGENEYGERECIVKNLIIGRNNYGSIRFPGYTDVYGLNLDELVRIERKEVSVYPNDDMKPNINEGLNKLAQICLQKVWPIDKSNGEEIKDPERLTMMNFEERLKRSTERMEARFISYKPEDGMWIFEVDHFSKYAFLDSDDEEPVTQSTEQGTTKKETESSNINTKKEIKSNVLSKNLHSSEVISAEADSMSNLGEEKMILNNRSAMDRLFNISTARNITKVKQPFYNYDSDDEMLADRPFTGLSLPKQYGFEFDKFDRKDQPKSKRFETCEMGEGILTNFNNSKMDYSNTGFGINDEFIAPEQDDKRPIKPLIPGNLAATVTVELENQYSNHTYIPSHLRDVRSLKLPCLSSKFLSYFDNVTNNVHKRYSHNIAFGQGDRFRVNFHVSCNSASPGLKYFKINSRENDSLTSFKRMHKKIAPNALMVMRWNYLFSPHEQILMESILTVSEHSVDVDNKCPLWVPSQGLDVLNCYYKACVTDQDGKSKFSRIIRLCNALWNKIQNSDDMFPQHIQDLGRKQVLSKWIKMECRKKLTDSVNALLSKSAGSIDIDKCNTVILTALCSGEVKLACQLATATKQYRLALLISQAAGNTQGRDMIREQLNHWILSRTDEHIPTNILCIYLLLSGQASVALSNGLILAPFKEMSWVQAFGSHFWYSQPYNASIKSAIDLYDDAFKTEHDIPSPYPIGNDNELFGDDDEYPFYDCCYHLIKLYCDRLYDLDVILNPPTVSTDNSHKLSCDWSVSWHLANVLTSIGICDNISPKISTEWAAQLERGGAWKYAAFVILHISDIQQRSTLLKNLITRHMTESEQLIEDERFLVDQLKVPVEWIHEGKAIRCRATQNRELEAFHWLKAGQIDKSHHIYISEIVPNLMISDKFVRMKEILDQFVSNGAEKVVVDWACGGGIYLQYIFIVTSLSTLKLTNKLANHSFLIDGACDLDELFGNKDELENEIEKLKNEMSKLSQRVSGYKVNNGSQRICKQQFVAICDRFMPVCSTEIY